MTTEVRDLRDARIRRMLATGDTNGVVIACDHLARHIARSYWIAGGEPDDLLQEVRLGIAQAARDYQPGHGASFWTFADLCGRRRAIDAVNASRRRKHETLNTALSFDAPAEPDAEDFDGGWLTDEARDPCDILIGRERFRTVLLGIATLSDLERECMERYAFAGEAYEAIGRRKTVDNAIMRARRKLRVLMDAA
jgi:RNA polymerase sporulation-specific sigma factor